MSLHESFYDLGGDSLSALTTVLRMEALGIDPDTARGLLEPIGNIPPAEAEANFYAALETETMAA